MVDNLNVVSARTVLGFILVTGGKPRHAQQLVVDAIFDGKWVGSGAAHLSPVNETIEQVLTDWVMKRKISKKNVNLLKTPNDLTVSELNDLNILVEIIFG